MVSLCLMQAMAYFLCINSPDVSIPHGSSKHGMYYNWTNMTEIEGGTALWRIVATSGFMHKMKATIPFMIEPSSLEFS